MALNKVNLMSGSAELGEIRLRNVKSRLLAIIEISSNVHTAYLHEEAETSNSNGNLERVLDKVVCQLANMNYAYISRSNLIELSRNMFSTIDILMNTRDIEMLRKTVGEQLSHALIAGSTINESQSIEELRKNWEIFSGPFNNLNHLLTHRMEDLCNIGMSNQFFEARRRLQTNY